MKGRVLIVDDDKDMCELLEANLVSESFEVKWRTSAPEALDLIRNEEFDVLLTDIQMPGFDGIELCNQIVGIRPDVPVVVITAFGSMETAVAALKAGAYDFVSKPVDSESLALVLERAIKHRKLLEQVKVLRETVRGFQGFDELIGASPSMKKVFDMMARISDLDTSVLIVGESGTGKELVARAIHRNSPRKDGPFVAFNCAAVPEALLESELFGHAKGAFTDARTSRDGLFIKANGGTLLLDEIGDMSEALQPKLLRTLEQRTVRPVGSDDEIPFDVRIIASTNRDIESAVDDGKFREDLFFRLNVIQINLPPLRARDNDIVLLAQHFLTRFAASSGRDVVGISTQAAEKFLAYSWPGNVRELRNCIERAVALARLDRIVDEDLPEKVRNYHGKQIVSLSINPEEMLTMEEVERKYVAHVLEQVGGNRTHAARVLGLDRKTLYRKIDKYSLEATGSNDDE